MAINTSAALSPDILLNPSPGCINLSGLKTLNSIISEIFANGERGFTRTPGDLSTMYQDAAGTVPVTAVGQPVGLMLDKSKGLSLSVELNPNTSLDTLTGWTVGPASTAVVENSEARVTFGGGLNATSANWFSLTRPYSIGKVYTVSFDATYISGGNLEAGFGYAVGIVVSNVANGGIRTRYTFTAGGNFNTNVLLAFAASSSGSVWKIDNVSVKEVTGNHSYQTTSSMRPLLAASPQRLDYDTVDDKLITTLPDQLTGCTVVRSVPNVGTQILANQTIPTTYNDSTDHCGLIVINRALTATETSQITAIFNKAAGV